MKTFQTASESHFLGFNKQVMTPYFKAIFLGVSASLGLHR